MLSKRGIKKLEKIMLANRKYYDQQLLAEVRDCGTMMCAAGFCRLIKVGAKQFNREAARHHKSFSNRFAARCLNDGKDLLGIKTKMLCPQVFSFSWEWPDDLADKFKAAKGPMARVRIFI